MKFIITPDFGEIYIHTCTNIEEVCARAWEGVGEGCCSVRMMCLGKYQRRTTRRAKYPRIQEGRGSERPGWPQNGEKQKRQTGKWNRQAASSIYPG